MLLATFFFTGSCLPVYGATVDLTWNANLEPDISGYKVYFGNTSRTYGTPVDVGNNTAYTLNGLSDGTYFFAVTAYDASMNESPFSSEVSKVISNASADTAPPVISQTNAAQITEKGAAISWLTDEPASTQIEYGTTSSYGLTSVLEISLTSTHTQILANLVPATTYHYRLLSRDASGNLATSGDNTFTTTALPQTINSEALTIFGINVETPTSTSAIISWQTNKAASSQVAYGTTTNLGSRTNLDTTLLSNHRQQLKDLLPDTLYYFQVVSANGSPFSSEIFNFKTGPGGPEATPPDDVVDFSAIGGSKFVLLTWQTPLDPDFVGVRIRFRTDRFPTDINDGTLLGDISGPMDEQMGTTHRNLDNGLTYYYLAASYDGKGHFQSTQFAAATPSGFVFDADDAPVPGSGCGMIFRDGGKPPGPGDASGMILFTGMILLLFVKRRWRSLTEVKMAAI